MAHILLETFVRGLYALFGLDSPFTATEYGPNWSKQRRRCLDRDGMECRICETPKSEIGQNPSVHHITPRKKFDSGDWATMNDLSNLVSLCPSCHGKYEGRFTNSTPAEFVQKAKSNNT